MKAEHFNKQLAEYTARAFASVPDGELVDRVEVDNNTGPSGRHLGTMDILVHTIVLAPTDEFIFRQIYRMTAEGLVLVGRECG